MERNEGSEILAFSAYRSETRCLVWSRLGGAWQHGPTDADTAARHVATSNCADVRVRNDSIDL